MTFAEPEMAVVLVAHGTVESLDDLPEFLRNIRRGHEPPSDLVAEVRRRYEAIGGRSPLNGINREVARALEERLGLPVRLANRLWRPYPKEVVAELASQGVRRVVAVPLAQHSAGVYGAAITAAAREVDPAIEVVCAPNWGRTPELTRAFADAVLDALAQVPAAEAERTAVVLTAHSLPMSVVRGGDPYEREVRASAQDVVAAVRARGGAFSEHMVAFQSQGIDAGGEWLGPDLRATLAELSGRGRRHVVLAPIGFLADHVEILYDLDIEARSWARELGVTAYRSASLNASSGLVDALASVARDLLGRSRSGDRNPSASPASATPRQVKRGG
jgi:ferrochelatase